MSLSVQTQPIFVISQQLLSLKQVVKPGPLHVCQAPKAGLICNTLEVIQREALPEQNESRKCCNVAFAAFTSHSKR